MREQSGRSLIEIIGVLAITGVMSVGAITVYNSVHHTQIRTVAASQLEQLARNVKILMEMRGTYQGVSIGYLVQAGALKSADAPIGGEWSVTSEPDGMAFSINLTELSEGDCDYFAVSAPAWAAAVVVNGYDTEPDSHCFSSATNQLSFIVE